MPVPVHADSAHVGTPGLVEPALDFTGVTELRVHGVGGTTPAALLGDLDPQQVAGNGISGFYRTADAGGRHVEAYSWGGFTSRSASRVLWLLLLPFLLANLAGWMCDAKVARSPRLSWSHRAAVRIAALAVTVNVIVLLAAVSMDVVGWQCGGQPGCRDHWYLLPLRWSFVDGHPARRVLEGALLPLLVVVLAAVAAWVQPRAASVPGELPGIRNAINAGYGGVFGALALVLAVVLVSTAGRGHERGTFWFGAPFVVMGLAVALLNAALLGVLVRIADLFGDVRFWSRPRTGPGSWTGSTCSR
jgi:hypothetical protein